MLRANDAASRLVGASFNCAWCFQPRKRWIMLACRPLSCVRNGVLRPNLLRLFRGFHRECTGSAPVTKPRGAAASAMTSHGSIGFHDRATGGFRSLKLFDGTNIMLV